MANGAIALSRVEPRFIRVEDMALASTDRRNSTWLRALARLGCVSVIIPVYNASDSVGRVVEGVSEVLEEAGVGYEVIVVDDGSLDCSFCAASRARIGSRGRLVVLRYRRNRGKGFAVLLGLLHARCPYTAFIDGDGDIDPRQLLYILAPLLCYDVVVTSKWHPESIVAASGLRRILSLGFRSLVWFFTGLRLWDTQTGAKAFRTDRVKCLIPLMRLRRYAFDVELLTGLHAMGSRMLEVPSVNPLRLSGVRVVNPRRVWGMFVELLAVAYRHLVKGRYRRALETCKAGRA